MSTVMLGENAMTISPRAHSRRPCEAVALPANDSAQQAAGNHERARDERVHHVGQLNVRNRYAQFETSSGSPNPAVFARCAHLGHEQDDYRKDEELRVVLRPAFAAACFFMLMVYTSCKRFNSFKQGMVRGRTNRTINISTVNRFALKQLIRRLPQMEHEQ